MQALELEDQLQAALETFDVEVLKGRDYVQVRPRDVNKGVFVTEVLRLLRRAGNDVDLVIAMGDDTTDESMFEAAQAFAKEKPAQRECITCTIGSKPSRAQYYVMDVSNVHEILDSLKNTIYRSEAQRDNATRIAESLDDYDNNGAVYI